MPKIDESKTPIVGQSVEPVAERKTFTKWEAFEDASLVPVRLTCQSYQPVHQMDSSCHTNVVIGVESLRRHLADEHGATGGFEIHLRQREGAKTSFWKDVQGEGLELGDFRCDVCDEVLPLSARRILPHLRPHSGKQRAARQGGKFLMTFRSASQAADEGSWEGEEI